MRAYLIDAAMQRIVEFDYNREHDAADEILGCDGRGGFTLGSGPLAPPKDWDNDDAGIDNCNVADYFLADYCYVRDEGYPQIAEPPPGLAPPWHIVTEKRVILGTGSRLTPIWSSRRTSRSQAVGW